MSPELDAFDIVVRNYESRSKPRIPVNRFVKKGGRPRGSKNNIRQKKPKVSSNLGLSSILLPFHLQETFIENFAQIVRDYAAHLSPLKRDSILEYYGLNGPKKTLEEIGQKHSVTRERIRQIKGIEVEGLVRIFRGFRSNGYRCDSLVLQEIYAFYDELKRYKLLSQEGIEILCSQFGIEYNPSLFRLFCDVLEIEVLHDAHCTFFKSVKGYSLSSFIESKKSIESLLQEGFVLPLEEIEKMKDVSDRLIPSILLIVPHRNGTCQIPFENLKTYAQVHRVFLEEKRKIHYKELESKLRRRGIKLNRLSLTQNRYIEPIGKTGYWVLKGTLVNTDTYSDMIEKIVRALGAPIKIGDLVKAIKMTRPEFRESSIHALIKVNPNVQKIEGRRVILKEWSSRYSAVEPKNGGRGKAIKPRVIESAVRILKGREYRFCELAHMVSEDTGIFRRKCEAVLCKSPIFNRRRVQANISYYSLNGKERLIKFRSLDKFKDIREYIVNRIRNEGPLNRAMLVEDASKDLDVSRLYVYKTIQKSEDIFSIGERKFGRRKSSGSLISLHEN